MRFELIDQILEKSDSRIVGIKNVTSGEEYLGDHFPGFPILPGVMMLETMAQAGRLLVGDRSCACEIPLIISQVKQVKYGSMVKPGQTLKVEVDLKKTNDEEGCKTYQFMGVGYVEGQVAVKGRFALSTIV